VTLLVDGLAAALAVVVAVLAPIAAAAVDGRDRDGARAPLVVVARRLALPAGALAAIALWLPAGAGATLLTLPYAIACALFGLHGLGRLAARGLRVPAEVATAAGLVLWPGGALWLLAHRAGVDLLGYPPLWVGLTAAHFPSPVRSCRSSSGARSSAAAGSPARSPSSRCSRCRSPPPASPGRAGSSRPPR
jgi:hypothetical protein